MTDLPAKPANPMEDFKQRVLEKLKTDIGALMPDEALAELVRQAVRESFFQKIRVPKPGRSHYSDETIETPSWFQAGVVRLIEPILKAAVQSYVKENKQVIDGAISDALERDKLHFASAAAIGDAVRSGFSMVASDMMSQLKSSGFIRNY